MRNQGSESQESQQLELRLRRLVGRLRRRAALAAAARWLPPLQLIWLALFVFWRLGWVTRSPFAAEVLGTAAAILLVAITWAAARAPQAQAAALLADRRLGTREVLAAAWEADPGDRHPLVLRARARASAALEPSRVREAFPSTRPAAWRGTILGSAVLLLASFIPLPTRVSAAVPVDPTVTNTAEILTEELEELAERVEEVDRPETDDAFARLQDLVDELRRGEVPTVEEALIELASFEEAVSSSLQAIDNDDGLSELLREFAAEPPAAELAEAMAAGDVEAFREALAGLAESLPASEAEAAQRQERLQDLAQRFEELAATLDEEGRWAEAALLRQLAEALREGDFARARDLLGSDAFDEQACSIGGDCAGGGSGGENVADEILELAQLARHLLGTGLPRALAQGASGEGARGPGRGPGPGTTSTNSEDAGYETGDAIVRHRQDEATSDRTGTFESQYESQLLEPRGTEDVRTPGEVGETGEMLSREGRGMGVDGSASLPLRPLSSAVPGAPEQAGDLESVPLGYRDLVREYFQRPTPPPPAQGDPP